MDHRMISQLTPGKKSFRIEVRIARLWESTNPRKDDELWSLDVVLIDEEASAIQGTIKPQYATYYKQMLKEGDIYLISNFVVAPTKQNFRAVRNDLILRFDRMTSVKKVDRIVEIPTHSFSFVAFGDLADRVRKDVFLSDVIGRVVSVGHIEVAYIDDKATNKKNLHIEDLSGNMVQVTLWGKVAEDFPEQLILEQKNGVVIVFAGMTVRFFDRKVCLCSCSATKFYLDLGVPEVIAFQRSLTDFSRATILSIEERKPVLSPEQQANDNRKTVLELDCLYLDDNQIQDALFSCQATIVDIDASEGWWYGACPECKIRLVEYGNRYWCDKCCLLLDASPLPWYKVDFVVRDDSGQIRFIAFEKVIEDLIGISASGLTSDPHNTRIHSNCLRYCKIWLGGHIFSGFRVDFVILKRVLQ